MPFKKFTLLFPIFLFLIPLQGKSQNVDVAYNSETLRIVRISENIYRHVSYLETETYGKVACNGLIFIKNKEAAVFDTPAKNKVSVELLNWLTKDMKSKVKAVVINHFHIDCLGGLEAFHKQGITSYSSNKTIELAKNDSSTIPQIGFEGENELDIGGERVHNSFFGEAHTKDNIISYIPSEEVIFGGCMVKSINASKGNLQDANVNAWPKTIQSIKEHYPNLKVIVPGHGKSGGMELLEYTIELFKHK